MIVVNSVEFYWGVEDEPRGALLSRAWLVEDLEPYRRSLWGFRIRLGKRAIHFGRCERRDDPHRRLPEVDIEEISTWRGPHNAPTEATTVAGPESNGSTDGGDPVPDAGGVIGGLYPPVHGVPD